MAYKFLVIKSEAFDILVDTLLESRDVTFFKNIFPMNVAYSDAALFRVCLDTLKNSKIYKILDYLWYIYEVLNIDKNN